MFASTPRRRFLIESTAWISAVWAACRAPAQAPRGPRLRLGLVTYLWGKDLALPELIDACARSGVLGLELRTTHQHGVEPSLPAVERRRVRERFADSPVTLVGLGSNERYDSPDPAQRRAAIEATKAFIRLSHDVGGSGVKVKGDEFHRDVPRATTLAHVVDALVELGDYADQFNQEVRLEVHGGFSELPVHHEIISQVDHPRVRTCWNSNRQDLDGAGLRANFELVRGFFGKTAHIRQLDDPGYPWQELIGLFTETRYDGWLLLEAHGEVAADRLPEKLTEQRRLFEAHVARTLGKAAG